MPLHLDVAKLDLRGAFDFAILIEEDAQLRYERIARRLEGDPGGAGDVFRMMALTEGEHRSVLVARRDALFREDPPRIDVSVLDHGVEGPDALDDELPRTAREALAVALAAEHRAHRYYEALAPRIPDLGVRAFFRGLSLDEAVHAELIAEKIAALGDGDGGAESGQDQARTARAASAPEPAESYPDRAYLESVLPRFDAATQAVARGVIVEGLEPDALAALLGVSRGAVARKVTRFVAIARQHLAVALASATLAGCAVGLPHPEAGPPGGRDQQVSSASVALPDRVEGAARAAARNEPGAGSEEDLEELTGLAKQIHGQVAARMTRQAPAVHRRVARAIVTEAKLASLDPLLVLALIHVESSFDPQAASSAGAMGLMQLLEPTMRRELERAGLPAADPRDPVANVQAGVRYFRRLVGAFGQVDVALMAYNAGPNRILGHLRDGGIPVHFHGYPRKVNAELERLRLALGRAEAQAATASAGPEALPATQG
jgi:rubrerythrin